MNHNYSFVLALIGIAIGITGMVIKNPLIALIGMFIMFVGICFQIEALKKK